jgi:AMP deaminase
MDDDNRPRRPNLNVIAHSSTQVIRISDSDSVSPSKLELNSKALRTVPRKLMEPDNSQLKNFDEWLETDEPTLKRSGSYTKEDKISRGKLATNEDIIRLKDVEEIPYRKILFSKIPNHLKPEYEQEEVLKACSTIMDLLDIREKYIFYDIHVLQHPLDVATRGIIHTPVINNLNVNDLTWAMVNGVIVFYSQNNKIDSPVISVREFYSDLQLLLRGMYDVVNKSFCHMRLKLLQSKFELHLMCNSDREQFHQKFKKTKDFYNIIKVDNHVHLSAAMNQKHLQKFMKFKLSKFPDEIVYKKNTESKTLKEVFDSLNITVENLTVDLLDVYADHKTFHRFDRFNSKYNPMGTPVLREIFLKTDNYLKGKYFAEITKEVILGLEKEKYILSEYRVSIYGRSYNEWELLAIWFRDFKLKSKCVRWLIQVPRLYNVYKAAGNVNCFMDMLNNIFGPVVEATLNPDKYPHIAAFLTQLVGFDSVDDESKNEKVNSYKNYKEIYPEDWTANENPPYSYWSYYIYANLYNINNLRKARNLNTFAFRPHCGEAGSIDHLATAYLTAHSINHGIELQNSPVLQYLFYLKQIGLSMSPLSNNKLFLKFLNNPFQKFFCKGLNVTLSTDDPLMIHLTREPLLEEYSVIAQALDMSSVSLCELARNSVLQSGFPYEKKKKWLGDNFMEGGPFSNDTEKTSLSWIRYSYRYEAFKEEIDYISRHSDMLYSQAS